jgi:hypothetical protein
MTTRHMACGETPTSTARTWAWIGLSAFVVGIVVTWGVQFVY